MGTAAGTAKSPSHIPSSPGAIRHQPGPALHMFLLLDLHHAWSIMEEEEGEEGRQEASCLLGSAGDPPPAPGSVGLRAGGLKVEWDLHRALW